MSNDSDVWFTEDPVNKRPATEAEITRLVPKCRFALEQAGINIVRLEVPAYDVARPRLLVTVRGDAPEKPDTAQFLYDERGQWLDDDHRFVEFEIAFQAMEPV